MINEGWVEMQNQARLKILLLKSDLFNQNRFEEGKIKKKLKRSELDRLLFRKTIYFLTVDATYIHK